MAYGLAMVPLNALAFALLGTLIITYRPDNRFGWLANLYGVGLMWATFVSGYGQCAFEGRAALPGGEYAIWLYSVLNNVAFMSLALMPWLFPDGRFLTARWRRVGLAAIALALVFTGLEAIWPAPLPVDPLGRLLIDNPFGLPVPDLPWLDAPMGRSNNLIVLMFLAGIVSLVLRWRRLRDLRKSLRIRGPDAFRNASGNVLWTVVVYDGQHDDRHNSPTGRSLAGRPAQLPVDLMPASGQFQAA